MHEFLLSHQTIITCSTTSEPWHACLCCCVLVVGESRATVPLKGDVTKESIEELLKSEKLPAVIDFTDKNSQKIFSAGIEKQVGGMKCNT